MKHVHIIGICGTFMAGIAVIAKQLGWRVTGCDQNTYPPMSTLLEQQGVELIEGFSADQVHLNPDLFLIGNVVSRGNPLVECILRNRLPYQSAPAWLYEQVLCTRHVLAVSGTHGKTTTSAILVHLLQSAGHECGFLVGGVLENFSASARLGTAPYFVIEADEYDTAFFDKQAKFLHYQPSTLIINNLEFDHADIYENLDAIIRQFHFLLRMLPSDVRVIANQDPAVETLLAQGCWSEVERLGEVWQCTEHRPAQLMHRGQLKGDFDWSLIGSMNRQNALAAIAAAYHIGIPVEQSLAALKQFKHVKRRQTLKAVASGIKIYDDFAHHPTAIRATLSAFREEAHSGLLWAVFDPASNSMKGGTHAEALMESFVLADEVVLYDRPELSWSIKALAHDGMFIHSSIERIIQCIGQRAKAGDVIVCMSNGSFQNIHQRLEQAFLSQK